MDHGAVVSRIVEEIKNDGSADFNLDDPFDDPSLVTTAFMDIVWQDEHGNSALMLAAAENRVLHVKGILTMAINSGKLWQVIDMRNHEGLNCVQMAVRAGSETCAMLITKVAREYAKHRPRPLPTSKIDDEAAKEEDITFDLQQNLPPAVSPVAQQSSTTPATSTSAASASRKLSREKISNNLRHIQKGQEYLRMAKRSRSAHSRLFSQRTFSIESGSADSDGHRTPELPLPPQDHGVLSTMGEKIRSIFGKKPPIHSASFTISTSSSSDRLPLSTNVRSSSSSCAYHSDSRHDEDNIRLPQSTSDDDDVAIALASDQSSNNTFRNSLWSNHRIFKNPTSHSSSITASMMSTPNGVRLPPLSLRRRANTEPRHQEFSSLGDDN